MFILWHIRFVTTCIKIIHAYTDVLAKMIAGGKLYSQKASAFDHFLGGSIYYSRLGSEV